MNHPIHLTGLVPGTKEKIKRPKGYNTTPEDAIEIRTEAKNIRESGEQFRLKRNFYSRIATRLGFSYSCVEKVLNDRIFPELQV